MGIWISTRPEVSAPGVLDSAAQEAHITLAYLDKRGYTDEQRVWDGVQDFLRASVRPKKISARLNGLSTWIVEGPPEPYVLVASVASNNSLLNRWREALVTCLESEGGFAVDKSFPFIPHITLSRSYAPYTKIPLLETPSRFVIDNLYVSRGSNLHKRIW